MKKAPRQRDRNLTEDSLVTAAGAIFSKKGYESTTTKEIADEAGCAEALIHRYFGGKNGLLIAVVKAGINKTPMIDIAGLPYRKSLLEEVRQIFLASSENLKSRSENIRIVFSRALIDPKFDDFKNIVMRPERLATVEKRLRHYQENKQMAPGINLAGAAEMILGLIFQLSFVHREIMDMGKREYEEKMESFCDIFTRGIRTQAKFEK